MSPRIAPLALILALAATPALAADRGYGRDCHCPAADDAPAHHHRGAAHHADVAPGYGPSRGPSWSYHPVARVERGVTVIYGRIDPPTPRPRVREVVVVTGQPSGPGYAPQAAPQPAPVVYGDVSTGWYGPVRVQRPHVPPRVVHVPPYSHRPHPGFHGGHGRRH